jgi:DNA-binding MarR family transcriptional regulator
MSAEGDAPIWPHFGDFIIGGGRSTAMTVNSSPTRRFVGALSSRKSQLTHFSQIKAAAISMEVLDSPDHNEMSTLNLEELAAFVAVVRARSFTVAAKALGMDKAQLSRVVSRLESRLGARLLQRSTRSLSLTEVGREFYERAVSILAAVDDTEAAAGETMGRELTSSAIVHSFRSPRQPAPAA